MRNILVIALVLLAQLANAQIYFDIQTGKLAFKRQKTDPWTVITSGTGSGATTFSSLSGVAAPSQLATGTPAAGKYVDGTGVWTTLPVSITYVQVSNYAAAVAQATGSIPKRIRVTSDINSGGVATTYEYWPDSVSPDKLELQSF